MTKAKIYNLAMTGLLKNREFEEGKLKIKPDSELAVARIAKVDNEIAELHEMILQAEQEEQSWQQ